ncbi:MAG TPA: alanine--tRNA ligase, partial [Candidatus Sumerlaeota bacterium]|nr:alanine--tRNA ligase [Candidatus Sumerlaeota bacterium]
MNGKELRKLFLEYFMEREHRLIPSAPLIPPDDPSLLFTTAGMVQFKRLYAGEVEPLPYTRACSVQKCLRAGGKNSDLENVGRTLRHHTFFEMLGNFSFGDYFKREAIAWGWDFVINIMKLPKERLFVSTFEEDPEAPKIWEYEQGVPRSRIIPLNAKENFWGPAGDSGACGPCSEILFFMGSEEELAQAENQDVQTIASRVSKEGDLFFEIWNMVFPQFDQQRDGSRLPLKYRGIDTGAGLERMTTAQNFIETGGRIGSPYETDLLWDIVKHAAEITGLKYIRRFESFGEADPQEIAKTRLALNAIADHTRALVFALAEGIIPSNEGRGYVLRRIQRRALRFAHLLGVEKPFMYQLVDVVIDLMGEAYPLLKKHPDHIRRVIHLEEEHFLQTLSQGESILSELIEAARARGSDALAGEDVFKLHATYGYPADLTAEVAADAGLNIDREGFNAAMKRHREEAKKSWKGADLERETELLSDIFDRYGATEFLRDDLTCDSPILAIIKNGKRVQSVCEGEEAILVLSESCFYGESGGQTGDTGVLTSNNGGGQNEMEILDTLKTPGGIHLHKGKMTAGEFFVGDVVSCAIDAERRFAIMRNHTATHLLQGALRSVVGSHIAQQGSYVTPECFRFDFANPEPLTAEQIARVEEIVQREILKDTEVVIREMPLEEARQLGAIAPFGEKYGVVVRVVSIGDFSLEFCGGTHCSRTGQIGTFLIESESSIASGIRRIEAKTGMAAFAANQTARGALKDICALLSAAPESLAVRIEKILGEAKDLKKEIQKLRQEKAAGGADNVIASAREAGGVRFIAHRADGLNPNEMRNLADTLRAKIKEGVVVIGGVDGDKVSLICASTEGVRKKVPAGKVIKEVAKIVGGGGG